MSGPKSCAQCGGPMPMDGERCPSCGSRRPRGEWVLYAVLVVILLVAVVVLPVLGRT